MNRLIAVVGLALVASVARADSIAPPWVDSNDVPLPSGVVSVAPVRADTQIFDGPGSATRRGTSHPGVRLPLYAAKRGPACGGRWLLVGPMAWVCQDAVELSKDAPSAVPFRIKEDGLPYSYFFVRADGASVYRDVDRVEDEGPESALDPGTAIASDASKVAHGESWVQTLKGRWIAARELQPARASSFEGVAIADGKLEVAWVVSDVARVYSAPNSRGKVAGKRARFERLAVREERAMTGGGGLAVRVSADGASPEEWIRATDLARPTLAPPPPEAGNDRWIDVELASQTLVAYDGARPVYATLVSTGRGAAGTDTATPPGLHRIWAKLRTTDMTNLKHTDEAAAPDAEDEDPEARFLIEDVPYVQFFDGAVALHGAFWHRDFGRVKSHGCVNLTPKDAAWLFGFTAPHLPAGWTASLPTPLEPGTLVRVR